MRHITVGIELRSYAQLGASYGVSDAATATVARAHADAKTFMNADGTGEAVIGASTSQLLQNLAGCYARLLGPGDEVKHILNMILQHPIKHSSCWTTWPAARLQGRGEKDVLLVSNC